MSAPAKSGPPKDTPPKPAPPPPPGWRRYLLPIGIAITVLLLFTPGRFGPAPKSLTYSQFVADVNASQVKSVTINSSGAVKGTLTSGKDFTSQIPTALGNENAGLLQL